jgi:gamma-butyrobetaine dioxygenase
MADDLIRPMLRALRKLEAMLFDEANQVEVPVGTGEALFFNNQRVLHGRTAFAPDGERFMRTGNVELDEFYSTLRMLARDQGSEAVDMHLPHGALT